MQKEKKELLKNTLGTCHLFQAPVALQRSEPSSSWPWRVIAGPGSSGWIWENLVPKWGAALGQVPSEVGELHLCLPSETPVALKIYAFSR